MIHKISNKIKQFLGYTKMIVAKIGQLSNLLINNVKILNKKVKFHNSNKIGIITKPNKLNKLKLINIVIILQLKNLILIHPMLKDKK